MASASTALQAIQYNSLSQFRRKKTSFGTYDEKFDDINELKTVATKDKKLGELIALFEDSEEDDIRDSADGNGNDEVIFVHVPANLPLVLQGKAELTKIERRSFLYKLWLRRIGLTRQEGNEGYVSSLEVFELALHNAQKTIKRYRDAIYMGFYNEHEFQQIIAANAKALERDFNKVLEEKEKSGFEMIDEDVDRFMRQTVQLCALLGLKLDFLDRLETFPEHHFHHRSLCEWIIIFLQNNSRAVSLEKRSSLTSELLDYIGFDPLSTAAETIMARSSKGNKRYHIEPCEWAEIFVQDEFKYNPLLSSRIHKFPFEGDLTNSWFQLPPNADVEESENDPDLCQVNIMNFVATESNALKDIYSKLDGFLSQSDGATVLYHGTDHRSAVNILFRGIYLRAGRQNRDFSCGSGFYLTKNLDEAVNWALSTTENPAILVFQVNRKDLDSAKRLDLNNDEDRWREIVTSFRSGRRTADTRKSVSAYDLIEGPQATMSYDEASGELLWKHKSSSYQMCLISNDFAKTFKKSLHSIFFWGT